MEARYPEVEVTITSDDRYSIMGQVSNALREENVPEITIQEFYVQANALGCDLLTVCMDWVTLK